MFVTGVASGAANEVTLRELVESEEARSLSLSHSHLALGRRTDGEVTGMDVTSGGGSQGDEGEPALGGQRDEWERREEHLSAEGTEKHTRRLRGTNREAVFRDGYWRGKKDWRLPSATQVEIP